jgi:hypothetical protein
MPKNIEAARMVDDYRQSITPYLENMDISEKLRERLREICQFMCDLNTELRRDETDTGKLNVACGGVIQLTEDAGVILKDEATKLMDVSPDATTTHKALATLATGLGEIEALGRKIGPTGNFREKTSPPSGSGPSPK